MAYSKDPCGFRLAFEFGSGNVHGAGCRNRTRDLMITNQLLYQLS